MPNSPFGTFTGRDAYRAAGGRDLRSGVADEDDVTLGHVHGPVMLCGRGTSCIERGSRAALSSISEVAMSASAATLFDLITSAFLTARN